MRMRRWKHVVRWWGVSPDGLHLKTWCSCGRQIMVAWPSKPASIGIARLGLLGWWKRFFQHDEPSLTTLRPTTLADSVPSNGAQPIRQNAIIWWHSAEHATSPIHPLCVLHTGHLPTFGISSVPNEHLIWGHTINPYLCKIYKYLDIQTSVPIASEKKISKNYIVYSCDNTQKLQPLALAFCT